MPIQTFLQYSTSSYFSLSLTHTDEGNKPLRLRHFVCRPRATHDDAESGFTQGQVGSLSVSVLYVVVFLSTRFAVCVSVVCSCVPPHKDHCMCSRYDGPVRSVSGARHPMLLQLPRSLLLQPRPPEAALAPPQDSLRLLPGGGGRATGALPGGQPRHQAGRAHPQGAPSGPGLGPKTATFPLCLGCHRRLPSNLEGYHVCSGCNWPLCGPQCEGLAPHQDECRLMRESGHRADIPFESPQKKEAVYCNITPLRCLLLREKHPDKFATLLNLQSHLEDLRDTSLYNLFKTTMIGFLLDGLQLTDVDPEMILRMCAILDTNAFDVRRKKGEVNVRGVYPTGSFLSHDCTPNTKYTFVGPEFSLVLTATIPIRKGDIISTTYTRTLWGTLGRRANLRLARCFDCTCARCSDCTELGTHAGAISCAACKRSGRDSKVLSTNPLDSAAAWRCKSCPHSIPGRQMAWGNDAVRQEMEAVNKRRSEALEEFLEKYGGALHSTNSHILEMKYVLARLYGNEEGRVLSDLSDEHLERKIDLCHELLEVADALSPGMSRMRGVLLFELQAAMVVNTRREFESDQITKERAQEVLGEAMTLLQSSAEILRSDPDMKAQLEEKLVALAKDLEPN
uniref:SET domain-containing protein n=1 Tax=Timema tahoe TaxID=61484 RepID=A0A7R9FM22_9NEOP|nr:unnamed protein product [Timema tahoe]